jgi:organic hydroperoxide reductase OsmC/OhrA
MPASTTRRTSWSSRSLPVTGIEVVAYEDQASGLMAIRDGKMRFVEVTLAPKVTIAAGDLAQAEALHENAHEACFIANSVNFPVLHMPTVTRA